MSPSEDVPRLSAIDAKGIDPRDTRWEREPDTYRVYFWGLASPGVYTGDGRRMFPSSEYELTGARDIGEVLLWAKARAEGRTYTVYALIDDPQRGKGLILLLGVDPASSA